MVAEILGVCYTPANSNYKRDGKGGLLQVHPWKW